MHLHGDKWQKRSSFNYFKHQLKKNQNSPKILLVFLSITLVDEKHNFLHDYEPTAVH